MLKNTKQGIVGVVLFALMTSLFPAWAQQTYRSNDSEMNQLIGRIERRTITFRQSLDEAINNSRLDGSNREDSINTYVSDFERAVTNLRESFRNRRATSSEVQEVLNRASYVDNAMQQYQIRSMARRDWNSLRVDLNQLARSYNVAWNWNNRPGSYPGSTQWNNNASLTGTYRLNQVRSENANTIADRAVRSLPYADRQNVRNAILRRLQAPETIAIDQRGNTFTIASSLAPQITFTADGRNQEEYTGAGRRVNVNASLNSNHLVINAAGDRGSDFQVTFDPINNGRELRVTRQVYVDRLSQPVIVTSTYDRTSDIAELNIYNGNQVGWNNNGNNNGPMAGRNRRNFYIPNGTELVATLNNDLSTKNTREGDRFTMTVQSPSQYAGATIEGFIGNVDRGGRITGRSELAMNFERIRMRNGQTYEFTGYIENVRTPNGENIRVDNEGTVKEENSQTQQTVTRAGIGAALGAVIGAIAGGGKGAAIGAAVGAGAGAGSVFIQGRDDLDLRSGTELTIRTSSPNN